MTDFEKLDRRIKQLSQMGHSIMITAAPSSESSGPFESGVPYFSIVVIGPNMRQSTEAYARDFSELIELIESGVKQTGKPLQPPKEGN